MNGKITLIILGAGASACYENKGKTIPAQNDILRSFVAPKISRSSPNIAIGNSVIGYGLTYSAFLANYLINKFNIIQRDENMLTEFWEDFSKKGINLESLYEDLEKDISIDGIKAKNDFLAILMSKIRFGTGERLENDLCKYHIKLARNLEPLDYIISFNWDTLIDDALLFECPFWFPYTGYGVNIAGLQGDFFNKRYQISSLVHLYHIHGSIGLYEPIMEEIKNQSRAAMVLGRNGISIMYELSKLLGIEKPDICQQINQKDTQPPLKKNISDEEHALLHRGCIKVGKENEIWLQPIFITPSKTKSEYKNWYFDALKKIILAKLLKTERIIIIGYSFPSSDFDHLNLFLMKELISPETEIMCINLENHAILYQNKVKQIFGRELIDFSVSDFKEYCNKLAI